MTNSKNKDKVNEISTSELLEFLEKEDILKEAAAEFHIDTGAWEKILAAKRSGLKEIILCSMNEKDVKEIDSAFIKGMQFHYVKTMQQVLELALV